MDPKLDLQELKYVHFPEEVNGLFDKIYYNSFAIFITAKTKGGEDLKKRWKELESFIAAYIQNDETLIEKYFDDSDIIWDIYIILFVDFEVEPELKMEIESDRFFCKKTILKYDKELSSKEQLKEMTLYQRIYDSNEIRYNFSEKKFIECMINQLESPALEKILKNYDILSLNFL